MGSAPRQDIADGKLSTIRQIHSCILMPNSSKLIQSSLGVGLFGCSMDSGEMIFWADLPPPGDNS